MMGNRASIIWSEREPASSPALTLLFLFLLVGSGVLESRPGNRVGTSLCAAARVVDADSRRLSGSDRTLPEQADSELRPQLPATLPAFRSLKGRGIPAPRAPDHA
jgi:hypothetical protein